MKLGFSLKDYYELNGEDSKFGYVDVGVLFTVPFAAAGSGTLHGGVNFLGLGDATKAFNADSDGDARVQVIASVGIGVHVLTHAAARIARIWRSDQIANGSTRSPDTSAKYPYGVMGGDGPR